MNSSTKNIKIAKDSKLEMNSSSHSRLKNKENHQYQRQGNESVSQLKPNPEAYLDARKLALIKHWVDEVNRVQAKSGKWGETINKILFYD